MASLRRTEAAANRQRHEDRHMGAFSRIYPTQDPARQALYAQALQAAAAAFAGSMKAKAHSTIERLQVGMNNEEEEERKFREACRLHSCN